MKSREPLLEPQFGKVEYKAYIYIYKHVHIYIYIYTYIIDTHIAD